ncbi:hypothetical protein FHL15_000271 [Xylaria flabelliformis]|uniref:Uncharacterized protein n=1 Tax=Xylaria flabelliformis TaxID=2512241 RepID=A0A553IFE9_9PEZI|nr:hypothetical protein FHL15_000271 [Xylaria flabelliformis]
MDSPLVSTLGIPLSSLTHSQPANVFTAEPEPQTTVQKDSQEDESPEPGEVPASGIKHETNADKEQNRNMSVSPLAHTAVTSSPAVLLRQYEPQGALDDTFRPMTAIQRRNQARLSEIVTRLQNFSGSVTQLLAIASVQQQLDAAFADLDRAKNQLKDVFRQFELQGHISNRQCQKKNGATRDLTRASQRIVQLTKELCDRQR